MTDRISTAELRKLLAEATPGRRVQYHPAYCPEAKEEQDWTKWDSSHETSVILPDGTRYRGYATHKHAADATLDVLSHDLAAEVIELREALTAVSREYDPSDGCNNAMTMHDIALAALNHKETDNE